MTSLTWWFILFILCVLLELSSPGFFFFLALACGAAVAGLISLLGLGSSIEFAFFIVSSIASCFLLIRYVRKSKDTLHSTNVYALVGKQGVVTETIAPCHKGWVKIEGELWAALSKDETVHAGMVVEVLSTSGSHVIVKKIKDYC